LGVGAFFLGVATVISLIAVANKHSPVPADLVISLVLGVLVAMAYLGYRVSKERDYEEARKLLGKDCSDLKFVQLRGVSKVGTYFFRFTNDSYGSAFLQANRDAFRVGSDGKRISHFAEVTCPKCSARILDDEPGPLNCFSCGTPIRS